MPIGAALYNLSGPFQWTLLYITDAFKNWPYYHCVSLGKPLKTIRHAQSGNCRNSKKRKSRNSRNEIEKPEKKRRAKQNKNRNKAQRATTNKQDSPLPQWKERTSPSLRHW